MRIEEIIKEEMDNKYRKLKSDFERAFVFENKVSYLITPILTSSFFAWYASQIGSFAETNRLLKEEERESEMGTD